jgi:hypothetical protein
VHNTNFLDRRPIISSSQKDEFSVGTVFTTSIVQLARRGGLGAVSASAGLDDTDQTIAVSNVATLSPRMVNETRAQFTHSSLRQRPRTLLDQP